MDSFSESLDFPLRTWTWGQDSAHDQEQVTSCASIPPFCKVGPMILVCSTLTNKR